MEQREAYFDYFLQIDGNIALEVAGSVQHARVVPIGALERTDHQRLHRPVVLPERIVFIKELNLRIDVVDL